MHNHIRVIPCLLLLLVGACGRAEQGDVLQPTAQRPTNQTQDIAKLLQQAPSTDSVTLAAYTWVMPLPNQETPVTPRFLTNCPSFEVHAPVLTDVPVPSTLRFLGSHVTNSDPAYIDGSEPWVLPLSNVPLPYHAQYKGHRNDPVFAKCPHADHIFVIDSIVQTYADEAAPSANTAVHVPESLATWPRFTDAASGMHINTPPDWQITTQPAGLLSGSVDGKPLLAEVRLQPPQDTTTSLTLRVYQGTTYHDVHVRNTLSMLQGMIAPFQLTTVPTDHDITRESLEGYFGYYQVKSLAHMFVGKARLFQGVNWLLSPH